jgi:hypothetical protein
MKSDAPPPWMPNNCAVREHTADGVSVGRCMFFVKDGVCPRHGDVRKVQEHLITEGTLTNDHELPPRTP